MQLSDPEFRQRSIENARRVNQSPEVRAKRSEYSKRRFSSATEREKMSRARIKGFIANPDMWEAQRERGAKVLREWHASIKRDNPEWHKQHAERLRQKRAETARQTPKATISAANAAGAFLMRYGPIFRCDDKGNRCPTGKQWRRSNSILTDAEVIQRAERNGWRHEEWDRLAG